MGIYIHHLGSSDPVQHQQKGLSHSFQSHQQICSKLQGHLQSSTSHRKENLRPQNIITNLQKSHSDYEAIQLNQLVKYSNTGQSKNVKKI